MPVLFLPGATDILNGTIESGQCTFLLLKGTIGAYVVIQQLDYDWEVWDGCADGDEDHDGEDFIHGCQLHSAFVTG